MKQYLRKNAAREQFKSLDIKENVEDNAVYYGDDRNISTQIVTNFNYKPERD